MGRQESIIGVRLGHSKTKDDAQQIANALKRGGHHVFLDEEPASAIPKGAPSTGLSHTP